MGYYHDEMPEPEPSPDVAAENHRRRLEGCMLDAEAERRVMKETMGGMTEFIPSAYFGIGGADPVGYGWICARGD